MSSPFVEDNQKEASAEYLMDALCQLDHQEVKFANRSDIMITLRRLLAKEIKVFTPDRLEKIVALGRYLCDWPLLIKLYEHGLWSVPAEQISLLDSQLGHFEQGLKRLQSSDSATVADVEQTIRKVQSSVRFSEAELRNADLSLTPVQFHHVADFGWQYADRNIAQLCNLPDFASGEEWLGWLHACQQEKGWLIFAIIDQDYGFIGSVTLQLYNHVGFFYYWLGKDFQNRGYGPKAVNIMLTLAKNRLGMNVCFAKVFQRNMASHKAMKKIGFERLPYTALPPSEDEVFYYQGPDMPTEEKHQALANLLDEMKCHIMLSDL